MDLNEDEWQLVRRISSNIDAQVITSTSVAHSCIIGLVALMRAGRYCIVDAHGDVIQLPEDWQNSESPRVFLRPTDPARSSTITEVRFVPMNNDALIMLNCVDVPVNGGAVENIRTLPLRHFASSSIRHVLGEYVKRVCDLFQPQQQPEGRPQPSASAGPRGLPAQQGGANPPHQQGFGYGERDLAPAGLMPQGGPNAPFDRRWGGGMAYGPELFRNPAAAGMMARFNPIYPGPSGMGQWPGPPEYYGRVPPSHPPTGVFPGEPDPDHAQPFFSTGPQGVGPGNQGLHPAPRSRGGGGFNYGWM